MSILEELLGSPQPAGVWNLVPNRSTIAFRCRSLWGLLAVKGKFSEFSGDGQVTAAGSVFGRIDIRAASLGTGIGKRDEHLRSADFFDVEKYPDITVVVTAAQPTTGGAELRAGLTIKGTALPIELPATIRVLEDGSIQISARTTVDRSQFGVNGNLAGMVGQTTTLSAETVFARAPE
jgi:polyisoprenoid-binding protein YceI